MSFLQACKEGDLAAVQSIQHTIDERNKAFRLACQNGHLEVAQWVYTLGDVDYHTCDELAF